MKRKLNKWLSGVLAACVLFTTVPVYAINDISGTETSTEVVETSEETQSSEIETSSTEETNQESSESIELSETTPEKDSKVENTSTESIENTTETSSKESSKPQASETADEMLNISPTDLGDEEEPSTDNWELGLVFYDSTVDNGKTPLTSIDWDASDGGYGVGETRVITVQINYKNTNAVTTYQPGEIEIKIPNLIYGNSAYSNINTDMMMTTSSLVGANDSTHTGYDWDLKCMRTTGSDGSTCQIYYEYLIFTNANVIEEKANFEGTICFLQPLFGENCKKFLENVASPFWRKLQQLFRSPIKTGDSYCRHDVTVT